VGTMRLGCVLAVSGSLWLLTYDFASLLFYILTIIGVFVLEKRTRYWPNDLIAFGYPLYPLFMYLTSAICITLVYDTLNTGLGLGIVFLGFLFTILWWIKKRIVKLLEIFLI
jgi:APA family basic amino acid/polyamine antiporter